MQPPDPFDPLNPPSSKQSQTFQRPPDDFYSANPATTHSIPNEQHHSLHHNSKILHNSDHHLGNTEHISYYRRRRWYHTSEAASYTVNIRGLSIPAIRRFAVFHYFQLFAHCLVLFNAFISTFLTLFEPSISLGQRLLHIGIIILMILIDLYMSFIYYKQRKYAPYSLSAPLLYIKKQLILIPKCPETLFISDKLGLLCQGYLFVVLPYFNLLTLIYTPDQSSQQKSFELMTSYIFGTSSVHSSTTTDLFFQIKLIFIYVVLFQLCVTLWTWLTFCMFYTIFVYEVIVRTLFFTCCCFRSRTFTMVINTSPDQEATTGELQLLLPTTPNNSKPKTKFVTEHVYHNHYAYQQHLLNKKSQHGNGSGPNSANTSANNSQFNTPLQHQNYNSLKDDKTLEEQAFLKQNSFELVDVPDSDPTGVQMSTDPMYNIKQYSIDQQEFIPSTPYRDHIFVSHISDPIFYKPYEFLWVIM